MDKSAKKNNIEKIEKVTNIFTIFLCVCLGSIFLAACTYMINLINKEQEKTQSNANETTVQNMNFVNM